MLFLYERDLIPKMLTPRELRWFDELSPLCVWSAMEGLDEHPTNALVYARCDTRTSTVTHLRSDSCKGGRESCGLPRPCVSKRYVMAVYTAIMEVSQCLEIRPKELFTIVRGESQLHLNVGRLRSLKGKPSYNEDWGIAQLTPAAINPLWKSGAIHALADKPECKQFRDMLRGPLEAEVPCERMVGPENPALSLLYGGLLYKEAKHDIERSVTPLLQKYAPDLEPSHRQALIRHLARFAYNGGTAPVASSFSHYLAENGGQAVKDSNFRKNFGAYFQAHYGEGLAIPEDLVMAKRKWIGHYALYLESWTPHTFLGRPVLSCTDQ
jgi:hypothetical protein